MRETELENKKEVIITNQKKDKKIRDLEHWFRNDYLVRLASINRAKFLGYKPTESLYSLQLEAYNKENELRELQGNVKLPTISNLGLL